MEDLFDRQGRRIPPNQQAELHRFLDEQKTRSFAQNLSFPLQHIFQLIKKKSEALLLLKIRQDAEKLDIYTSQLIGELQQREVH